METKKPLSPEQMKYLEKLGYPMDNEFCILKSNSFKNPGREYVAMNTAFCFFLDKPQKYVPKKTDNPFRGEEQPVVKKQKTEDDRLDLLIQKLDTLEQMLHELLTK